ncbi:MAG: ankyrin repeat domain-containing protein [Tepidisphaeraceae bacterium]|jgi:hypothetical protein
MRQRSSSKRSRHHLKHLVEEIVATECRLAERGLAFIIDEIEVIGAPPERLRVWATLHFLPLGSPFCCREPGCHLFLYVDRLERVNDALRRRLGLRQDVSIEFVDFGAVVCDGVEFDMDGLCSAPDPQDIDQRDALGRTALMRAAMRGYDYVVEDLLAAGADPTAVDHEGRSILDRVGRGNLWIISLLEDAIQKRVE